MTDLWGPCLGIGAFFGMSWRALKVAEDKHLPFWKTIITHQECDQSGQAGNWKSSYRATSKSSRSSLQGGKQWAQERFLQIGETWEELGAWAPDSDWLSPLLPYTGSVNSLCPVFTLQSAHSCCCNLLLQVQSASKGTWLTGGPQEMLLAVVGIKMLHGVWVSWEEVLLLLTFPALENCLPHCCYCCCSSVAELYLTPWTPIRHLITSLLLLLLSSKFSPSVFCILPVVLYRSYLHKDYNWCLPTRCPDMWKIIHDIIVFSKTGYHFQCIQQRLEKF